MTLIHANHVHYHAIVRGRGEPILLLHGFSGGAADWEVHAEAWADRCRTIAVDLLGHGGSDAPSDPVRYGMRRCVDDLAVLLDELDVGASTCVGYSMGGRLALAFALAHPERVRALVLEGASPGIHDGDERHHRRESDEALATRIEREGVASFVDEWLRQPLFATQERLDAGARERSRRVRCANRAVGLANCLRGMGTGAQASYWDRLAEIESPVLLVAGTEDAKLRVIAEAMGNRLPRAEVALIEAGHNTHLENPVAFGRAVADFFGRCGVFDAGARR